MSPSIPWTETAMDSVRLPWGVSTPTYGLDPYAWAQAAVQALRDYHEGKPIDKNILIVGTIVTIENLDALKAEGALWGAASM